MEKELRLLRLKDFSGLEVPSNPFQQLLMVAMVASSVHENNKNKNKSKSKEKNKKSAETHRALIPLQKRKRLAREKRLKKPSVPSPFLFLQQLVPSSFSLRLDPSIDVSSSSSLQQHDTICSSSESEKEKKEVMMMNAIASTDDHHLMAKKQKKNHHHGECSNSSISLRRPSTSTSNTTTTTSPVVHELTNRLRDRITQIGGAEIILVIQKRLSDTDVSKSHSRLSIPLRQAKAEFLTAHEKDSLGRRIGKKVNGMEVPMMVEPDLEFMTVTLKRWDMKKGTGKTSSSYVLVSEWNKIVEKIGLKKEDGIQLWSFRSNTQLCFALVQF
ncbi:B3 domain-containing protein At2g24670-like [Malania oleifera]|uniref:B3 domain-containing protein At2g24670-like n=1 Tax=Malania oleifera TaxID=397392 RepID=UPI0025ADA141|nr:B3 domain-containing protein At2g24670-like [Malania oleifera]